MADSVVCAVQQVVVTGLTPDYEDFDPLNPNYLGPNDGRCVLYVMTEGQVTVTILPQLSTGIPGVELNDKVVVTQTSIYLGPFRTDWYNNEDGRVEFSAVGDGEIIPNIAWLRL